ncbi:MAG TPA: hypothetical protein VHA33_10600 [Candidatus Angelobacter sp.]|nr:hypothetical protein [Candidatus Angelobacter sp.]
MVRLLRSVFSIFFLLLCSFALAQPAQHPATPKPEQTPRQALIEIITGGGKAVQKHVTMEVLQMAAEASAKKDASSKRGSDISRMLMELSSIPSLKGEKDLKTFDSGSVLLSFAPNEKEKVEVRVESDDLSGNQDEIQLSLHVFRDGQEQSIPFMPSITVGLKQQDGLWRLNEVGGSAKLEVGDPKFFTDLLKFQQQDESEVQGKKSNAEVPEKPAERPKIPASSIVSMLGYAEMRYAHANPEIGFTCNLAELFANNDPGFSEVLDPQVGTGSYNGYRFTATGCDGKPASTFHLIAEPIAAGAGSQAFCTDPTHNIRISDDGRAGTCLASGRMMKNEVHVSVD